MIRYLNAGSAYDADLRAWKRASTAAWKRGEGLTQSGNVPGSDEPLATDENGDPIVYQGAGYPHGYIMSANGKRRIPLDADGLPLGRWRRTIAGIGQLFRDVGKGLKEIGDSEAGAAFGAGAGTGAAVAIGGPAAAGGGDVEAAQAAGEASNA